MLFILFGSTVEMGKRSRDFFINNGFELIQKYHYVPDDFVMQERFGERNRVTKDTVLNCDFIYEHNGMLVGFDKKQIIDAVRGRKKCLLTTSAHTIDFIRQIKAAYGEYVTVIGTYIDEQTLNTMFASLPNVSYEEILRRINTGNQIKKCLINERKLFDSIVIYGGDHSTFNFDALVVQYKHLIEKAEKREKELNDKMYVEMRNIYKQYGNFRASDNVSFGIEKGKLAALLGPSGSGKSMVLKCIAGIMTPDAGRIVLDDEVLFDSDLKINISPQKRKIGYMYEKSTENKTCYLFNEKVYRLSILYSILFVYSITSLLFIYHIYKSILLISFWISKPAALANCPTSCILVYSFP